MPFHHLKTYIRNPSIFFITFFTLPPTGKCRWQPQPTRAYMHVGRWVLPSFYFCQVNLPNYWRPIFLVLPKLDGCQVVLPNWWSCSNQAFLGYFRYWNQEEWYIPINRADTERIYTSNLWWKNRWYLNLTNYESLRLPLGNWNLNFNHKYTLMCCDLAWGVM
jgi:hypothetical protein